MGSTCRKRVTVPQAGSNFYFVLFQTVGTVKPTLASTRARRMLAAVKYTDDDLEGVEELEPGMYSQAGNFVYIVCMGRQAGNIMISFSEAEEGGTSPARINRR